MMKKYCIALSHEQTHNQANLMNLILIRAGYPPVPVGPDNRTGYLDALERASLTDDLSSFQRFMHERLDTTLAQYIAVLTEGLPTQ